MGDLEIIPTWLKGLPLAPEYHPTETEFADPIAYISKIEKEASTFGICKVVPPLPKPSKKFVLSNLNKSLSRCPELWSDSSSPCVSATSQMGPGDKGNEGESRAVFTTRHQELGHSLKRTRGSAPISQPDFHKKVWQSGEAYTIDQFELKSKAFARSHLGNLKEVSPIAIEALFWKAAFDKPIYIEYANDVPGSGFGKPLNLFRYFHKRKRKQKSGGRNVNYEKHEVGVEDSKTKQDDEGSTCTLFGCSDREGTAGWKLSNSPWNLQVIARSPGSLTRFMPDDIPGVTSPMVYIGMLFSWFAWHVEDHELHSLNFLHMGSPKTWYGVPGNFAFALEEVIRAQGYGGSLDRLAALTLLGEKTTLLSPEVIVASGIPCCRLVQNPGEFVVTFPRAYHVGFSHGFNCGEAANFATPQWLKVAKEAAVRRAAMNYLPMLSHQQLLYMLTMSFASRKSNYGKLGIVLYSLHIFIGHRPSFEGPGTQDGRMIGGGFERDGLYYLDQDPTWLNILFESAGNSFNARVPRALLPGVRSSRLKDRKKEEREILVKKAFLDDMVKENHLVSVLLDKEFTSCAVLWDPEWLPSVCNGSPGFMAEKEKNVCNNISCLEKEGGSDGDNANITKAYLEQVNNLYADGEDDLPCGLHVDSGALACVACGLLGFPFMSIVQPSAKAVEEFFSGGSQVNKREKGKIKTVKSPTSFMEPSNESDSECVAEEDQMEMLTPECMVDIPVIEDTNIRKKLMLLTSGHEIGANEELRMSTPLPSLTGASSSVGLLHNSIASMNINGSNTEMLADTKFDTSNGAHTYNHSGESEAITEVNIIVKANPGGNFNLDTRPCETEEVRKPPSNNSGKFMKQWNTSSEFRRPRIFCLEHSLEIQQRMDLMGGVNVLIICHSDYPKMKEQALHIAEEIGVNFNCLDVPLANATQADLNLINISIDDEGHEECGEDWTSKLGLNLKYRVKLQKLFPSKKEHHTLALGGLFSDQVHGLNVPSLKWVSRRSRTHHKANRSQLFKREDDEVLEILDGEFHHSGGSDSESCPQLQPSRPRDRGRPRKCLPKEVFSCNDTITTIEEEGRSNGNEKTCSDLVALAIPSNSGNEKTCTDLVALALPTLPVSTPEASEKLEEIQSTRYMDMAGGTCNPCSSFSLPNVDILEADTSREQKEIQITQTECPKNNQEIPLKGAENKGTAGVFTTIVAPQNEFSKAQLVIQSVEETILSVEVGVGDSTESESPLNAVILTIENYGVHQNISTRERTSIEGEVSDSEKSASLSPTCKSLVESSVTELDLGTTQIPVIGKIYDSEEPGVSPSIILGGERYETKHVVSTTGQTVVTRETCDPVKLPGPPLSNRTLENSQMHAETQVIDEVRIVEEDCTSLTLENQPAFANASSSEVQGFHMGEEVTSPCVICTKGIINIENGTSSLVNLKAKKRKREMEMKTNDQLNGNSFIRSPCEGLRSRTGKVVANEAQITQTSVGKGKKMKKQHSKLAASSVKCKTKEEAYRCGTEGCCMSFATKAELNLHKQNRCTHEGCGKRFGSHRYVVYHQKVHIDERPLKCPWKGCKMSFKWSWARTEHLRVHTGERPYECKVAGCGLTFRFVSDFSRHRRKTAHFVD